MTHKGWHSRGYLPHFDSAETVQFITFRLFDSLPRAVAEALAMQRDNLAKTDERLDSGLGACWLREGAVAELVILGRTGPFWHEDYFDRFIRDEGHLARTIGYVENNPVKAGLAPTPTEWPWSSGRFRA